METFFPIDNSFFSIIFEGDTGDINISTDVISFSVTEEIQRMTKGSIALRDPYGIYSRYLKNGKTFKLSWGYKRRGVDLSLALQKNPSEMTGISVRPSLVCYIQSPGGGGDQRGVLTYNCNFYGAEVESNLYNTKWYRNGTKQTVILDAFTSLGVTTPFVNFTQMKENLTENNAVLQNETTYKFLNRLAFEWRCVFRLAYSVSGQLIGLFVDNNQIDGITAQNFQKAVTGGTTGNSKLFEYGINSTYPNVISYTWKHNIGDSGLGDGNRIELINGKPVVFNYTVENQTVTIQKLDESRLKEYIRTHPDLKGLTIDIVVASSLTSKIGDTTVGAFFDKVSIATAPQGLGYSCNVRTIGDPLFTATMKANFGNGFPDFFKNDFGGLNKFFIKKVNHTIDSNGYKCNLEIADAITAFGGFIT